MNLSIGRKLFLGYLVMAVLTIISNLYAVINLRHINDYTYRIIRGNIVTVEDAKALLDNLVDRESAFKRAIVLKDKSFSEFFWIKSAEFKGRMTEMKASRNGNERSLERIASVNEEYESFCLRMQKKTQELQVANIDEQVQKQSRFYVERMAKEITAMQRISQEDTEKQMAEINRISSRSLDVTLALALVSLLIGIGLAVFLAYNISRPLQRLENAAELVGQGDFDHEIKIDSKDEIGSLAKTFSRMMEKLKVLEAISLDASPLTGLPGNLAIEREIKKRLRSEGPFALCYIDFDNFKPFVDKYGYAWGSELIKEVASILTNRIKDPADEDTFIGHIGGDDFVIVAEPEKAHEMCGRFARDFAPSLNSFYFEEDRQRGYITGKDRKGRVSNFPLITVTVAIVTEADGPFPDPVDMAKKTAMLKEYGKTMGGSNIVTFEHYRRGQDGSRKKESEG